MKIKTTWKRAMAFLLTASLVCGSGAFIAPSTAEAVKKKKVSLTHKKVSVAVGKTVKLKLKNNKKKVTWTVKSGKKYVSLKSKKKTGVIVKGKKAGKAKVQAKIGKKEYTCTVTVKAQKSNKNNNSSDNNNNSSSHNSGNSVTQPNRPTDISKPTSTPSGNDEMEPEQTVRPTQKPQNTMAPELSPEEQIYADAETINVNSSIYGSVNEDVSTNYYKVIPGTRGRLNMVFAHTYQDSSDGWRLKIHIYKNGQKNLLSETDINLNDNEKYTLPFVGTSADGIYIIEVERNGWSKDVWDEEYTISASFKKGIDTEQEINDTYETATQLTLDGMYSGNINRGEDVDYYKITAVSDGAVCLDFLHTYQDTGDEWCIQTYVYEDGEYSELSKTWIELRDAEKTNLPSIGVIAGGVYYVKIGRGYGNGMVGEEYDLDVSFTQTEYYEKEVNDVYKTATEIIPGNVYSGNINRDEDVDYYKITAVSAGEVCLDFLHTYQDTGDEWCIQTYIYEDGEYNELSETRIELRDAEKTNLPSIGVIAGGVYYVKIGRGYGNGMVGEGYDLDVSFWSYVKI